MSLRFITTVTALVGGICWVANLYVDQSALSYVGAAFLAVAVAAVGAGLARQWWLGVITSFGSLALAWSVLELARSRVEDRLLEGIAGGLATLLVAVAVWRRPARGGNHRR